MSAVLKYTEEELVSDSARSKTSHLQLLQRSVAPAHAAIADDLGDFEEKYFLGSANFC